MRVLIVRVGAMGDVLHALPAAAALRRACPDWQIDWAVDQRWAPLLVDSTGHSPVVTAVHTAPVKSWGSSPLSPRTFGSIRTLRRALRSSAYDLAVDMQGTIRSAVIGYLAKAGKLAGYDNPRESAAKRLYGLRIPRQGIHVVEQGRALLSDATGIPLELSSTDTLLPIDDAAERWAASETNGARFCLVSPTAGWGAKQWPAERFGELARSLASRGLETLVNASRFDDPIAARVVSASAGAARVVASSIEQMTSLLRRATIYVGGDSGPTHLAAALGVPLVGLYGPTDPARNGPWGSGPMRILRHGDSATSHKRIEEIDRGLAQIQVSRVEEAVDALLNIPSS